MSALLLPLLVALSGCAARKPSPVAGLPAPPQGVEPSMEDAPRARREAPESVDHAEMDLLRAYPGARKIYVQATLPDGGLGLFLVDTGASISVISEELAERLDIEAEYKGGSLSGLSGRSRWVEGELPWVDLGGVVVPDVHVAVGVPGMPTRAGAMPIDGILGNNVWGDFILSIDYPADVLEVGRPGTIPVPDSATPMSFDGMHVITELVLEVGESSAEGAPEAPFEHAIMIELDTGAGGLLLSGPGLAPLEPYTTEGEEPIFGLGASDSMPVSSFYRRTRRVPVQAARLGGARVEVDAPGTWINYGEGERFGPDDLVGLAGHELLAQHRVIFDYPGGRLALVASEREPRQLDGHQIFLEQELAAHGEAPERGLERARLRVALEDLDGALADLDGLLALQPDDHEARSLRALILRYEGDVEGYLTALVDSPPGELTDEGEAVAVVNSLVLTGQVERALTLARACVAERPEDPHALLALSDALLAMGDHEGARRAISDAARATGNPDAFLKRRARVALAEGDALAAASHLRHQLSLYPSDGEAIWFYAMLVAPPELGGLGLSETAPTFRADLERAMARLHPEARPLDFLLAAHHLLGDPPEELSALQAEGIARDCEAVEPEPSRDNCTAWYIAMGGEADDEALDLIVDAVEADPHRPDFMDTLAMVRLVRQELPEASAAAIEAARLAPDTFYHIWQAERISRLAEAAAKE